MDRRSDRRVSTLPAPVLRRLGKALNESAPVTLQLLGRLLMHAAAVGAAVGVVSLVFVYGLDLVQHVVLERWCGYLPLRAAGEPDIGSAPTTFRPWLLLVVPGLGALLGGAITRFAPETRGGGSDAIIDAFHRHGGAVRRRVPIVKLLASIATLGAGGSGGREGPTMQIGGAIGSLIGRTLGVTDRERRILLVAGTAAGMAAVFRTPLGAALLAVEVLHRDDFESEALVPAVLASVISYSFFISFFGEGTALFAHAPKYAFVPTHLWLYAAMALLVSGAAYVFVQALGFVKRVATRVPIPDWTKPGLGGLAVGALATPIIWSLGSRMGEGQGLGILGGGYGAAQVAITGASWFPGGLRGVELMLLLGVIKIVATSLTVGSGGSAGDFGPSMVMGGIFGGAFGRAAQLLLHDPRIDPGAFALVGMGTFYGGLAHVPIGSLVMTCELAGSYDLLVPLMLAEGIAFVALRNQNLYHAQVKTKRESPAHREELVFDLLKGIRVDSIVVKDRVLVTFAQATPAQEVVQQVAGAEWQEAFPVVDSKGELVGVVVADVLKTAAADPDTIGAFAVADDLMTAPLSIRASDDLHRALEVLLASGVRELLVVDDAGKVVGVLAQAEITAAYLARTASAPAE